MKAKEFITELFKPNKKNWEWARLGTDEVSAFFKVGDREYLWQAFTPRSNPKKWEIQFRLIRKPDTDPDDLDLFGTTGTGSSAEVMSTAVDITRAFLKDYGLDRVEEITFNAKEDSRIGLYAKMIKRLLPDWDLHSKKDPYDGMVFTLTDRRAYDKPENKINEVGDSNYAVSHSSFTPTLNHRVKRAKIGMDPDEPSDHFDFKTDKGTRYSIKLYPATLKNGQHALTITFGNISQRTGDPYGITGSGDAVKIFSTVKNVLAKYLGEHPEISVLGFSAKQNEPSRVKLYTTFANQLKRWFPDFTKIDIRPKDDIVRFMIRKQLNATESVNGAGGDSFKWNGDAYYRHLVELDMDEAKYKGNIGIMEMIKFYKISTPEEKELMKKLLATGQEEEAWELLQKVTNDELVDEGWRDTVAGAALAGAMALGGGQADAKQAPTLKPTITQPAKAETGYNVLSNNPANEIAMLKAAKKAGLRGQELAQFMAQMKHESWDFERLKEKPQPGVKGYFAKKYDPKFAPKTAKILGNTHVGDGEKYHGRGFVQLTGRDNYRMAGQALGIDLLKHPELASKPDIAAQIAVWYWKTRVKPFVQNFADTSAVTKKINPAARGLESRHENFKDYLRLV